MNSQHPKGYVYWFVIDGFLFYCVKITKYQIVYKQVEKIQITSFVTIFRIYIFLIPYSNLE